MRDPARIKNILDKIEKAWSMYPDLRFFQYIEKLYLGIVDIKKDSEMD